MSGYTPIPDSPSPPPLAKLPSRIIQLISHLKAARNDGSTVTRDQLMKYCGNAVNIGRPLDKVMIMMVGERGTNACETINCLFADHSLCVAIDNPASADVVEYIRNLRVIDERPPIQADLSVINIPIISDASVDITEEAVNLIEIRNFSKQNGDLRRRLSDPKVYGLQTMEYVYPNLVVLVIHSIEGKQKSNLEITLRKLKTLNIVDHYHQNLIVVVTNAASLPTPESAYNKCTRDIRIFLQKLIFEIFELRDIKVVFVDNKEQWLQFGKPSEPDFYELPNGELSHQNLMEEIVELFQKNSDLLGILLCAWHFKNTFRETLKDTSIIPYNLPQEVVMEFLSSTKKEIAALRRAIKKSWDFCSLFGFSILSSPVFSQHLELDLLGRGYNVVYEEFSRTGINFLSEGSNSPIPDQMYEIPVGTGQIRYKVHSCVKYYPKATSRLNSLTFESQEAYQKSRQASYELGAGVPLVVQVASNGRWIDSSVRTCTEKLVSVQYVNKVGYFHIEDPRSNLKVHASLQRSFDELPLHYRSHSEEAFSRFFSKWGTHIITAQRVGGSIKVELCTRTSNLSKEDLKNIRLAVAANFPFLSAPVLGKFTTESAAHVINFESTGVSFEKFEIIGGIQSGSVQSMTAQKFMEWDESVRAEPSPMKMNFKLFPYYDLIKNQTKSIALERATLAYLANRMDDMIKEPVNSRESISNDIIDDVLKTPGPPSPTRRCCGCCSLT